MVTSSALIVPNYATIRNLHLFDTLLAVMLPFFGSALGTFLMRQTFKTIPRDLDDAPRMDRRKLAANFVARVHPPARSRADCFCAVVHQFSLERFSLAPRSDQQHQQSSADRRSCRVHTARRDWRAQWPLVTAGTVLVVAPLLLFFLIFQRQFIEKFLHSGLK